MMTEEFLINNENGMVMKYKVEVFIVKQSSHNSMWQIEETVKDITHGRFYIYINLGILSLCTESWVVKWHK